MRLLSYLDPGSASAVLAAILAGVAGIGAAIRSFGRSLMFWKKDEPAATPTDAADSSDEKPSAE